MSQSQNPKVRKERSLIHKLDYSALGKKERGASGKEEMVGGHVYCVGFVVRFVYGMGIIVDQSIHFTHPDPNLPPTHPPTPTHTLNK